MACKKWKKSQDILKSIIEKLCLLGGTYLSKIKKKIDVFNACVQCFTNGPNVVLNLIIYFHGSATMQFTPTKRIAIPAYVKAFTINKWLWLQSFHYSSGFGILVNINQLNQFQTKYHNFTPDFMLPIPCLTASDV